MTPDRAQLGAQLSQHKVPLSAALNNFGAAVLGLSAMAALLRFSHVTPKLVMGAVVMVLMAGYFVHAGLRLTRLTVSLHERGIRVGGDTLEWTSLLRGELRYVPGFLKKGLANERNRVSLVLVAPARAISIPHQLEGFDAVVDAVRARASYGVERVLVGSLFEA